METGLLTLAEFYDCLSSHATGSRGKKSKIPPTIFSQIAYIVIGRQKSTIFALPETFPGGVAFSAPITVQAWIRSHFDNFISRKQGSCTNPPCAGPAFACKRGRTPRARVLLLFFPPGIFEPMPAGEALVKASLTRPKSRNATPKAQGFRFKVRTPHPEGRTPNAEGRVSKTQDSRPKIESSHPPTPKAERRTPKAESLRGFAI